MPVIATPPLWMQNLPYSASADRSALSAIFDAGVVGAGDLLVAQRAAGTNMSVDVAAGYVAVPGTTAVDQGTYLCYNPAPVNVSLDPAPSAGTSRYDLIIAQVRDAQADLGANNDWQITVVTGTAASTPTEPSIPDSSVILARVVVFSTTAAITTATNIVNRRTFALGFSYATSATLPKATANQIVIETDTGAIKRGLSNGQWQDIRAGGPQIVHASGALYGTAPAAASTLWKEDCFSQLVGAIDGVGQINCGFTFVGILGFWATPQLNTTPIIVAHRTDHTPPGTPTSQIGVTIFDMGGDLPARLNGNVNLFVRVLGW